MANAPAAEHRDAHLAAAPRERERKSPRPATAHLKVIPQEKTLRDRIRLRTAEVAATLDKSRPLDKRRIETIARTILAELDLPEGYVGWTMVALVSEFWSDQVAAVPPSRRLLLLPHCLKQTEDCPARFNDLGLDCQQCGACNIAELHATAQRAGYRVLVAEGSPVVMKIIVSGEVDAILGLACLNVLEKVIDSILLVGIPCMAVPLLSGECRNSSVDMDWVERMIHVDHDGPVQKTRTYLHLLRESSRMFRPAELRRLVAPLRDGSTAARLNGKDVSELPPGTATEAIAYDFLAKGGKHARPFITLAVYDALTGAACTGSDGAERAERLPPAVRRIAAAIEIFHKASLVHDDVEDDDAHRYGHRTLHRKYGTATAINVGDYLIGLGYRLVSRQAEQAGGTVVTDVLNKLADAHTRLCEGQGAELLWRDSHRNRLTPADALRIYALKTAPAFEAALFAGARLAGPADRYVEPLHRFARNLGIAFQILNDLKDWDGDDDNKLAAGSDLLDGRPTLLWALAMEALSSGERAELESLLSESHARHNGKVRRAAQLYRRAGVFEKAARLVDKYQDRAEAVADEIEPEELRRLLYFLIDTVLARTGETPDAEVRSARAAGLTIIRAV